MEKEPEQKKEEPQIIQNINFLLEDKTPFKNFMQIEFEKTKFEKHTITNPTQKAKRILAGHTVRYYLQTYLYDEISKKFYLADRNYKNIIKDKLSSMKADKRFVRYCLLQMSEGEHTLFVFDKNTLNEIFEQKLKNFYEFKKKEKEKELKQIEREKILKEKEEQKKLNPNVGVTPSPNPLPPPPKKEIIIDKKIVEEVPSNFKIEEKIYYRIFVEDVLIDRPGFPQKANELIRYVKTFNEEISRLLQKKDFTNAETWCNEIKSRILNMGKGKVKNEYESQKFENKRKEIETLMKRPLLNLTYIYEYKSNENTDYIAKAIDLIENVYYKKYANQYDESYLKITGRLINFLIKVKDFSKAEKIFGILKENGKNIPNYDRVVNELEPKIKNAKQANNFDSIKMSKGKINAAGQGAKPEYEWEKGSNEEELEKALKEDFERVKANMEFVNNNSN